METGQHPLSQARVEVTGQLLDALAHSSLACGRPFGPRLGKAQVPISLGSSLKPLVPTPSKALGQESPSCSLRQSGTPSATPSFSRTPQKVASPLLDAPTTSLPVEASKTLQLEASPPMESPMHAFELSLLVKARKSTQLEASDLVEVPTSVKELPPPVEARNIKGTPSLPPISLRGDSSSSSSPF